MASHQPKAGIRLLLPAVTNICLTVMLLIGCAAKPVNQDAKNLECESLACTPSPVYPATSPATTSSSSEPAAVVDSGSPTSTSSPPKQAHWPQSTTAHSQTKRPQAPSSSTDVAAVEPTGSAEVAKALERYAAKVTAPEELQTPGPPGELKVWIGIEGTAPITRPNEISSEQVIGTKGETVKITPIALGIGVEPRVSECKKIDPSGSTVTFRLIPEKSGTFEVGADIDLYASADCSGIAIPKSSNRVSVQVKVNSKGVAKDVVNELTQSTWREFLGFWDKFLMLISALALFLIRKKIFKAFGFKQDSNE